MQVLDAQVELMAMAAGGSLVLIVLVSLFIYSICCHPGTGIYAISASW